MPCVEVNNKLGLIASKSQSRGWTSGANIVTSTTHRIFVGCDRVPVGCREGEGFSLPFSHGIGRNCVNGSTYEWGGRMPPVPPVAPPLLSHSMIN